MTTILITGASGNIGSELVKSLKAQANAGTQVLTLSSKAGSADRVASFESVEQLTEAFKGIDRLFVLLPLVPNKLELAKNVAAAAKAAGVKQIVRASGAGADANAGFSLPRLQGQIDEVLAQTGIGFTALRNAGFMQNYATFLAPMVKGGTVYAASADAQQSLVDVRDIAAVAAKVLLEGAAHAGKSYTLTGGESTSDSQRVAMLSSAIGKPVGFQAISVEQASNTMRQEWHMPATLVDLMDSLNTIVSAGYAGGVSPDVENLLGRKPIGFAQFAKDYAATWK
jgi:uncharacterized protein YbjT (DUF2867 family)